MKITVVPEKEDRFVFVTPEMNPKHRYLVWHGSHVTKSWTGNREDRFPSVEQAMKKVPYWENQGYDVRIEDTWAR